MWYELGGMPKLSTEVFVCAFVACFAAGCGHSATEAECKMILDKNVEVQLRALDKSDAATFAKKKADYQAAFTEELKGCIGKRITDGLISCIQNAQTEEQLQKCGR